VAMRSSDGTGNRPETYLLSPKSVRLCWLWVSDLKESQEIDAGKSQLGSSHTHTHMSMRISKKEALSNETRGPGCTQKSSRKG
jgi:hypothetical protein